MSVFDERFVQVVDEAMSWEEAIMAGGNLLLVEGKIEQSYIDAMIKNVRDLGPYIVIAPRVAMPHARPDDGVKDKGISVVVLREPTQFSDDPGHTVSLLVCLAAVDANSHLELLQTVSSWLADEDVLEELIASETTEALQRRLEEFYF